MNEPTDMFARWAARANAEGETPMVPAATVVVLRDGDIGIETLMLRRNSALEFVGGMWVFPGGRIDEADHDDTRDTFIAARNAAVREAHEESGQVVDPHTLVEFAHWVPPPISPRRFATWFFAAKAGGEAVTIDDGEIKDHAWMRPSEALQRRDAQEIDLAPPTWVTLHQLSAFPSVGAALAGLRERPPRFYMTHIARNHAGHPVAMWEGDAGYETGDPDIVGARHRLVMAPLGYSYEETGATQ